MRPQKRAQSWRTSAIASAVSESSAAGSNNEVICSGVWVKACCPVGKGEEGGGQNLGGEGLSMGYWRSRGSEGGSGRAVHRRERRTGLGSRSVKGEEWSSGGGFSGGVEAAVRSRRD